MRDSERRASLSMDELIMRTIGQMDLLPDRIQSIEEHIRELEMKFSQHEGAQTEGIKRISESITHLDKLWKESREETIAKFIEVHKYIKELKSTVGLTEEQKKTIDDLESNMCLLQKDYGDRQNVKKTVWEYLSKLLDYFLRYAMFPVTVTILLLIGLSPERISGFKVKPAEINKDDQFNSTLISIMSIVRSNQIKESQLDYWMNTHKEFIIYSNDDNETNALRLRSSPDQHIFIWMPNNGKGGYIQAYNKTGNKIGSPIAVSRGI